MSGSSYYDQHDFFEQFQKRRNRAESPNNVLEGPALMSLIGEVGGTDILDLGCGDGQFGAELLSLGASVYHGVDGSEKMIEQAERNLKDTIATVERADLNDIKIEANKYDLVVSRFVFHYIADVSELFQKVHHGLKKGGRFVFSVQHPVITASTKSADGTQRTDWFVDDYFSQGERTEPWVNQPVTKYHRTTEQYVSVLIGVGFSLENLKEGTPERHRFSSVEEYERRKRIPLCLILAAKKR
ncbi:class I SAM-dependent methyltransferase [Bacillus sp. Marseille-Q3570]|uniref:class I SAM-dependent DNA methyltransferase n=1 Tax=Bacillus sp. Marseille-Q3570 TaxID=2963522 RepID=UPI0021B77587|nr:class I SAM-dependent methyltransferase [Bacillus sp. Marseille-Q3570]